MSVRGQVSITLEELWDGEDIATCPSCTLRIIIIYEEEDLPELLESDDEGEDEEKEPSESGDAEKSKDDHDKKEKDKSAGEEEKKEDDGDEDELAKSAQKKLTV